ENANLIVDGRKVEGSIDFKKGDRINVSLKSLPSAGMHFLQVQNQNGLFSNDFIFHAAENEASAKELRNQLDPRIVRRRLAEAIKKGDLKTTRALIERGAGLNDRREESGMTPLSVAAFHGQVEIARYLLNRGAEINRGNRDGNTPLLLAAFMCREKMCLFLLSKGASTSQRNRRRENSVDVVSKEWSNQLADFYQGIIEREQMDLTVAEMETGRPKIKKILEAVRAKRRKRD
ncbi:MAG: ankyrin repeat domain-containing protein, partial [Planctomycetota bacterium]|nr:ankyrin repeat domain-containing protein [Planctomycetota bacterium]